MATPTNLNLTIIELKGYQSLLSKTVSTTKEAINITKNQRKISKTNKLMPEIPPEVGATSVKIINSLNILNL